MRQDDGQDVRHLKMPEVSRMPQTPTKDDAEAGAAMQAEREEAKRRRGRSATVIAGLYNKQGSTVTPAPSQKEVLGG